MQVRLLKMQKALHERNKAIREDGSFHLKKESLRQHEIRTNMETLPEHLRNKTLADFRIDYPDQVIVKKVAAFFTTTFENRLQESMGLTFLGFPGTGKTMLACIMFQLVIHNGFTSCYKPSLDFLREIQEKKFTSSTAYELALSRYKNPDFLIIDEATEGSSQGCYLTAWEQKLLLNIIDARQQKKRCTLLISNCTNKTFTQRVGNRIADRLQENGVTLTFTWESYRKNKNK
jgi:DNA replication protein DnaC